MDNFEAVRLWGLSLNFWQLTLNTATELVKSGNPSSMHYEGWGFPSDEEYEHYTRWSDLNIIEPTLFNFYHGMELSLKALIQAKGLELKNNHKLTELLMIFCSNYDCKDLMTFYEKYILPDNLPHILKNFCSRSSITMDSYYQSLKYPTSTKGVAFNHTSLRGHNEDGVMLFRELSDDLIKARNNFTQLISVECQDVVASLFED